MRDVGCAMVGLTSACGDDACPGTDTAEACPRSDEGFTLIEVMVALAIFLIVSAATLSLITQSLETIGGNADRVYAAALARTQVEELRTLGSAAIPLGATSRTVTTDAGTFLLTQTATWVDIGAPTNPCDVGPGVTPGKSYLRVRVDVEGGTLDAPQTVESVVYPNDTVPTDNTGTITVEVDDNLGEPVSGVTVSGTNGSQSFTQTTGPDGCVFAPDLAAGSNWSVSISKSGYITQNLNGQSSSGVVVNELQNTPLAFTYAASGSLVFTTSGGGYPLPSGVPFAFSPNTRNVPTPAPNYPATVSGLWPDNYTGWLRPCTGAGEGSTSSATLAQGATEAMNLTGTRLDLVGPEGGTVKATYSGTGCTVTYTLGTWDETLLVKASLPAGKWTFTVTGAPGVDKIRQLSQSVGLCSVSWNVPDAITVAEAEVLTAQREAALEADPLLVLPPFPPVLPEVSEPCASP